MDAPVHWEVPHFSRHLSYQIQAILARTRKISVSPWRILKNTFVTVIKDHQALIKGNRGRVLTNWRQAAWLKGKREFLQRRKLIPLFRRISQDPFDSACFIIEAYEEIFPARNDHRVICAIIGNAVVMEPVSRILIDELARIVSPGPHRCTDNVAQAPYLQNPS